MADGLELGSRWLQSDSSLPVALFTYFLMLGSSTLPQRYSPDLFLLLLQDYQFRIVLNSLVVQLPCLWDPLVSVLWMA